MTTAAAVWVADAASAAAMEAASPAAVEATIVSREAVLMGGRVGIHLEPRASRADSGAERDCELVLGRLGAWANRLTRFTSTSDLSRLNTDPRPKVPVRPTLAAALDWGRAAETSTDSIVNVAMLDQRLAAEGTPGHAARGAEAGTIAEASPVAEAVPEPGRAFVRTADGWSMDRGARTTWIRRPAGLRFDLDGVAKGWLADRALALLGRHPAAVVDADGDVSIRLERGHSWWIGIGDPDDPRMDLATLRLVGDAPIGPSRFGIATSGTSIHRWGGGDRPSHHLIDPRSGRPAATDVVQATVLAHSAREAEAYAKTAVILGSGAGLDALDRAPIEGAVLLTERHELLILPRTLRFLP